MKVSVKDIPIQGKIVEFDVELDSLNERIDEARRVTKDGSLPTPSYSFNAPTEAELVLRKEGATVMVTGVVRGSFSTPCVRCLAPTTRAVESSVDLILKPAIERGPVGASDEDVRFGFYEGDDIDCAGFVEEVLILELPYTVVCSEDCQGLCPICGKAKDSVGECERCGEEEDGPSDSPFAVLKGIKVIH